MRKLSLITTFLICSLSAYSQSFDYKKECQVAINMLDDFWINKFRVKDLSLTIPQRAFYSKEYPIQTKCGTVGEPNAFYCRLDNSISLSNDLFSMLALKYNNNGLFYFILSHEYGHLVQTQLNMDLPLSVFSELHADCLSGVFFNDLAKKGIVEQTDIVAIYSFLTDFSTKNAGWDNILNEDAHGDGQTRYKAFTVGYNVGSVNTCKAEYNNDPSTDRVVKQLAEIYKVFKN